MTTAQTRTAAALVPSQGKIAPNVDITSPERKVAGLYTSFVFPSASAPQSGATLDDDGDDASAVAEDEKDDETGRAMLRDGRCCWERTARCTLGRRTRAHKDRFFSFTYASWPSSQGARKSDVLRAEVEIVSNRIGSSAISADSLQLVLQHPPPSSGAICLTVRSRRHLAYDISKTSCIDISNRSSISALSVSVSNYSPPSSLLSLPGKRDAICSSTRFSLLTST